MIALLAAAILQAASPIGLTYDEAAALPANDLAVRALGESGRQYVAAILPRPEARSPLTGVRFFTQPKAASETLCHMRSTTVFFTGTAPGQEALERAPEGWRKVRKLVVDKPHTEELYRLNGLDAGASFSEAQVSCGRLPPDNEPGWFAADDAGVAGLAVNFARRLLPLERGGEAPAPDDAVDPAIQPLLARMRLAGMGLVKARECDLFQPTPGRCLVMYFSEPDDAGRFLTLIVAYQSGQSGRNGPLLQSVRATAGFVYIP